jgi:hypothetical protein
MLLKHLQNIFSFAPRLTGSRHDCLRRIRKVDALAGKWLIENGGTSLADQKMMNFALSLQFRRNRPRAKYLRA